MSTITTSINLLNTLSNVIELQWFLENDFTIVFFVTGANTKYSIPTPCQTNYEQLKTTASKKIHSWLLHSSLAAFVCLLSAVVIIHVHLFYFILTTVLLPIYTNAKQLENIPLNSLFFYQMSKIIQSQFVFDFGYVQLR